MKSFLNTWVAAVAVVSVVASHAAANEYCRTFVDEMESGVLYAAKCLRKDGCLQKVGTAGIGVNYSLLTKENGFESLEPGRRYNFIYKTSDSLPRNSLVVVQKKQIDGVGRSELKPVDVQIRRQAFKFSCQPFVTNVDQSAWPPDDTRDDKIPTVPFDKYDQFHRYGYTSNGERTRLWDKFHVVYYNGETCVSTLDAARRSQFLLYDRADIPSKIMAFLERINLISPNAATAATKKQMAKYEKLKVLVTNYQIVNDGGAPKPAAGCFGFSASTSSKTSSLELSVSDLEVNAPYFPLDLTKTWVFDVKKNPPPQRSSP